MTTPAPKADETAPTERDRQLADQYGLLAEHACEVVLRIVDGVIEWVSPSVEALTGRPPADVVGRQVNGFVTPDDEPALDAMRAAVRSTGRGAVRVRLVVRDGTTRWQEITARVTRRDGDRTEVIAAIRDVDDEVAAAVALGESEARYRALFANSASGLAHGRMITGPGEPPDWIFLLVNDAFERIVGRAGVVGLRVSELAVMGDPTIRVAADAAARVAAGGPREHFELEVGSRRQWLDIDLSGAGPGEFVVAVTVVTDRKAAELELAAGRADLAEAQRIAHVGSWTRDLRTSAVSWSDEMYRIHGFEPGTPVRAIEETADRADPDAAARRRALVAATMRSGVPWEFADEVVRPDGARRHVVNAGEAIRDEAGAIVAARGTVTDVTDLWEAQERARVSEERSAAVFAAVRESIAVQMPLDDAAGAVVDYEIEWVNEAWRERYGWVGRDPRGQRAFDIHPAFVARLPVQRDVLATGRAQRADLALGDGRWIEADYSRLGDRLLVVSRDISDRKAAEAALAESEERHRIVVTAMSEGVVLIAADGTVATCNAAAERILGVTADELAGVAAADPRWRSIHEDGSPFPADAIPARVVLATGRPCRDVVMGVHRPDGTLTWILVNAEPLSLSGGGPYAVVATFADITTLRATEQALAQARRMEMIGRLAAGVAHDFNNVLTSIRGYAESIGTELPPGDPLRADAAGIAEAVDGAAALSRRLLAFGRRQLLRPEALDPDDVVAASVPFLRSLCGDAIGLRVRPAPDPVHVQVDPTVLEEALVNLVLNARDATPAGGEVLVETGPVIVDDGPHAGRYVRVSVSDTGSGIEPDLLPRIFEPFVTTKHHVQGSGLGLSSVDGAIGQSGGFVTVDSRLGQGSTFAIHLPQVAPPPGARPAEPATRTGPAGGTETVLLVEDEALVRMVTGRLIRSLGYAVIEADRPSVALAIAAAGTTAFDVVLTDLLMPEMDGRAMAAGLREARPDLPVVFMSGYSPESIFADGVLPDGVPFLAKPFSVEVLAARLRTALDASRDAAGPGDAQGRA